ncbi:uncharacterized protein LOC119521208 [Choloepus didactylus]|uniref:uncharacterized protein LOC119521208 n=1 Tax=Choloepus didactylus TaxID=27675 RepID=UPI0018A0C8BE|nr:uncharacterized protein LOC119521208 [Choloepus didactylus]
MTAVERTSLEGTLRGERRPISPEPRALETLAQPVGSGSACGLSYGGRWPTVGLESLPWRSAPAPRPWPSLAHSVRLQFACLYNGGGRGTACRGGSEAVLAKSVAVASARAWRERGWRGPPARSSTSSTTPHFPVPPRSAPTAGVSSGRPTRCPPSSPPCLLLFLLLLFRRRRVAGRRCSRESAAAWARAEPSRRRQCPGFLGAAAPGREASAPRLPCSRAACHTENFSRSWGGSADIFTAVECASVQQLCGMIGSDMWRWIVMDRDPAPDPPKPQEPLPIHPPPDPPTPSSIWPTGARGVASALALSASASANPSQLRGWLEDPELQALSDCWEDTIGSPAPALCCQRPPVHSSDPAVFQLFTCLPGRPAPFDHALCLPYVVVPSTQ